MCGSRCGGDFSILCSLSLIVGRFSNEPAHIRDSAAQTGNFLRNGLAGMFRIPVTDSCGVRVCFGSIRGGFVFKAGRAFADSLPGVVGLPVADIGICLISGGLCGGDFSILFRLSCVVSGFSDEPAHVGDGVVHIRHRLRNGLAGVVGLPVADIGICLISCGLRGGDFGILCGLSCRVGRGIDFVVCNVANLFHVGCDSIATTVQSLITVSAFKLFLLHFLCNGRIGESIIPVRCITFKAGQAFRMLCDFCRIVRNVFRVLADIGVLNGLFSFQGINVGLVGGDTITQRGISIGTGLCFGSVCRLIGRVKLRNSLLAVGGFFGDSSGVCLLCGLCTVDFGVQTGGQVGNVGFNSIQTFAPCRHVVFPLLHLFVPAVNQVGKRLVVLLELLNQSGQIKNGFLQVGELIVIVRRFDPIFSLAFRVRGQLCTLRYIALRGITAAVMDDNGQRFVLPFIVPLHRVSKNWHIPCTDVHRCAGFVLRRRARVRGASVRVAAVTARRVGCTGNREVIAVTVCHNKILLS